MSGCKARKCIRNNDINRITMTGTVWNDFQRCNKKVYKDGSVEDAMNLTKIQTPVLDRRSTVEKGRYLWRTL